VYFLKYYFSLRTPSDLLWFLNITFILLNYYPWNWKKFTSHNNKSTSKSSEKNKNNFLPVETYFDLESRTSKSNLKRRYNFLMKKYHPDRTLDLDPEDRKNAIQKTIEINLVYQELISNYPS
jgi:hypothetical protein